jgi:sulfoxide reductase catalytic subunit YedY
MKIPAIPSSEITPKDLYLSRRAFMKAAGIVAGRRGAGSLRRCPSGGGENTATPAADTPNSLEDITHYNNYYEFTTDKEGVASLASDFSTSPWEIEVSGLVNQGGKFSVDELTRRYPPEERIYRLRCVEAWSMVIPWMGFPLARLLADVEPTADARYVSL